MIPLSPSRARNATRICSAVVALVCPLGAPAVARADVHYESTVTGWRANARSEEAAADASVITDERTPRAGEDVAQLIAELPGVTIRRLGGIGALAMLSLRGSTFSQVAVYVDGVPLNSGLGGGVDLSTLPLGDVERIELYRGVTPITFGGSALGGVLSITTRAPHVGGASGDVSFGSFGTYGIGASTSVAHRKLKVYVGAHYLTTVGDFWFTSDNGTVFDASQQRQLRRSNNAASQVDAVARVVIPIGVGRELSLAGSVFDREQGLAGYGAIRQTTQSALGTLRAIGSATYESSRDLGADSRLRAIAFYLFERQRYNDPKGEISLTPSATNNQLNQVGTSLVLAKQLVRWARLSVVLDGRYESFRPFDALARVQRLAPASRIFAAAGAEIGFRVRPARLLVSPSLRVEMASDRRTGRDRFGEPLPDEGRETRTVPTARLAVQADPTRWLLVRANAARYARLPAMSELFGDSGYVIGNPRLQPETGWNADVGVEAHAGNARFAVNAALTGFASFVEQLIQYQQESYGRAIALNLGRARILGLEAALEARLTRYARVQASFSFLDARDTSDSALGRLEPFLPNRPRFRLYVRPEAIVPIRRAVVLGAYVDVDVTDGNYLDPANLVRLPIRALVGAGVYVDSARLGLRVIASAQNLGDARVFDFAGFPLPSRSFFVTARLATAH